ncbi:MAG: hypothetical protein ACREQX_13735 [Candidatus Binataceae bacterium]
MTTRLVEIGSIRTPYASIGAVPSQPPHDAAGDFRNQAGVFGNLARFGRVPLYPCVVPVQRQ